MEREFRVVKVKVRFTLEYISGSSSHIKNKAISSICRLSREELRELSSRFQQFPTVSKDPLSLHILDQIYVQLKQIFKSFSVANL